MGRPVRFDVDSDEFVVDLLLFHVSQLRYAVIELKVGKFKPKYAGQLGFTSLWSTTSCAALRFAPPTVGILLCADRNERVVSATRSPRR